MCILFFSFVGSICFSQNADSLFSVYKNQPTEIKKCAALLNYADALKRNNIDSAFTCAKLAKHTANKLKNDSLLAEINLLMGTCEEMRGNYKNALLYFLNAERFFKSQNNKPKLTTCYNGMGIVYWYQGFFDKAIDYYKKNITISLQINDKNSLATCYGNIAIIFDEKKDLENSLLYYNKSLLIFEQENNLYNMAACYDNMSLIFSQKEDFKQALNFNLKSYKVREQLKDTIGMLASMENLGGIFIKQKKYDDAISVSNRVLNFATRLGAKEDIKFAYVNLKQAYEGKGDFKLAYEIANKLMDVKDSLKNSDNLNQIAELEAKFKNKEKETELTEIKLVQKLTATKNTEKLKRKNNFIAFLSFIGVLILLIAFLFLKRFKEKKLIAEKLSEKNNAIETQKAIIDKAFSELTEKSKDITDSIKYAKRIQQAIFPTDNYLNKLLPQSFVFFEPKDIVSGDFYWVEQDEEGAIYVAVVDCTGHGVPGAFMSIVGFNLINKALLETKLNTPADILNEVNKNLTNTLKQTFEESNIKDGMEISLCKWNKKTNEFMFAGANTIIYKVSNNNLEIIKGDKNPIGAFYGERLKPYTNTKITVKTNDCIYLFSDGYADQFGGEKGKKYKYKQFEEFLLNHSNLPMQEQRVKLKKEFNNWKGNLEQVDDVCVIGVKID